MKYLLLSLFCLISFSQFSQAQCSAINETDSLSLVNFYNAMNGDEWDDNSGWLVEPVYTWYGVSVNEASCLVDSISLVNNNLMGELNATFNLPELAYLNLKSNNIFGSLPDFTNLGNLSYLSLSYNDLSGEIPDFANLGQLEEIFLLYNDLSGELVDFSNLPQLTNLSIGDNNLSGGLINFSNLPLVEIIHLHGNELTDIIPDFNNIPNLKKLILSDNHLSGSIPDFSNLSNLQELRLNNNELTGIIVDFSNTPLLENLHLHNNGFIDMIPDFVNLPNLEFFIVCDNPISGYIPTFSNCPISPGEVDFSCLENGEITGLVYFDENENCIFDAGDIPIDGGFITVDGGEAYGISNEEGLFVLDTNIGEFNISYIPPNENFTIACDPFSYDLEIESLQDVINHIDFPIQTVVECPYLTVAMNTPLLRRCFDNNKYYIHYCNEGIAVENAYIELDLDEYLIPLESTYSYTINEEGNLIFELGDLDVFECGTIQLFIQVSCEATLGQAHCSEARIYPNEYCTPLYEDWIGNRVVVDLNCVDGDEGEQLEFNISNWVFDMEIASTYYIHRNNVLIEEGSFFLEAGADTIFYKEADGATWRLEAVPDIASPQGNPIVTLEGCGEGPTGGFSMGFVNGLPLGDDDHFLDIDCTANIGSYDPNDKQVFPQGATDLHCIEPNIDLDYLVRFQNTGTDTAFNIFIIDTLSEHLHVSSLKVTNASHDYELIIEESNILRFEFNNILLLDSNSNEVESHGFIRYNIEQQLDNPQGTYISNRAYIYFDYNQPIITNDAFNTIDDCSLFVVLSVEWLNVSVEAVNEGSLVKWSVASEQNLSHYEVEKSMDGNEFKFLGRVDPMEIKNYDFIDSSPIISTQYYRIKEISLDGQYSYSEVVSISPVVNLNYQLHPNPAHDFIQINFDVAQAYQIQVYDIAGQLIHQFASKDAQTIVDVSSWKEGTYLVQISNEHFVATEKIGVVR